MVLETARKYGMDLSRPLVLVSGGPDSVALLRVLGEIGAEPGALHVEHGMRGRESLADAGFVRGLCEDLGVVCEVHHLDLEKGSNSQERARTGRYRIAEQVAGERGLKAIATGHTADDVAETVLINLARGSGLRGAAGIPPVRGRLVRPLIRHSREDVLAYLKHLEQPYRVDSSNLTGAYARNRVRREVLPILEELYPGAGTNIARGAYLAREDLEALEDLAADVVHQRAQEHVMFFDELRALPHALRRYAVRQAYSRLLPGAPGLDYTLVELVLGLLGGGEGTRTLDLPGGVKVAARPGGELAFYVAEAAECGVVGLRNGSVTFGGWEIEVQEDAEFDARDAARAGVAYLDAGAGPFFVRTMREGDSIRPLGLGGSKKVSRALMDRGVPKDLRGRVPVVVDERGAVAWVFGGELSEEHKVSGGTEKTLRLEARKSRGNV